MKTSITQGLMLAALLTSSTVAQTNENNLYAKKDTNKIINVDFEKVQKGSSLALKDKNGHVLYEKSIEDSGAYSCKFNLTNLPDADYYFELDMNKEIIITPLTVKKGKVKLDKDNAEKFTKPEVVVKEDRVYISNESEAKQTWDIAIYYNEDYDLAYIEKIADTQNLKRVYDFSNSKRGNYTIVFSSEGKVIENSISFLE